MQTAMACYETLLSDGNFQVKVLSPDGKVSDSGQKKDTVICFNSIFTKDVFANKADDFSELLRRSGYRVVTASWEGRLDGDSKRATLETYANNVHDAYKIVKRSYDSKKTATVSFSSSLPFVLLSAEKNGVESDGIYTVGAMYKFSGRPWVEACKGPLSKHIQNTMDRSRLMGKVSSSDIDSAFNYMDSEFGSISDAPSPRLGHPDMPVEVYHGYMKEFVGQDALTQLEVEDFRFDRIVTLNGGRDYLTGGNETIEPLVKEMPVATESKKMMLAEDLSHRQLLFQPSLEYHRKALKFLFKD